MTDVKICGLTEPDTLGVAVRAGADYIGFMFVEKSPRAVTPEATASLLLGVGSSTPVAVVSDAGDELIEKLTDLQFPVIQLHGSETPQRVSDLQARTGAKIWKVISVREKADLALCNAYSSADGLLIESRPPEGSNLTGGHGISFDWTILQDWTAPLPWLLAGGLDPENVAEAIAATGATAVDVSSGVERIRGLKDAALIKQFITAAKAQ